MITTNINLNGDVFSRHYNYSDPSKAHSSEPNNNTDVYAIALENSQADDVELDEIVGVELDKAEEKKLRNLSKMLSLAVAYSSNIGGTATLTGSPTNLLVAEAAGRLGTIRSFEV